MTPRARVQYDLTWFINPTPAPYFDALALEHGYTRGTANATTLHITVSPTLYLLSNPHATAVLRPPVPASAHHCSVSSPRVACPANVCVSRHAAALKRQNPAILMEVAATLMSLLS